MEVTLIVVTLVSIALAIAMGILTWRLLQEERLRSDARVAALEQGLAETLQDAYVTQQAHAAASRAVAAPAASTSFSGEATGGFAMPKAAALMCLIHRARWSSRKSTATARWTSRSRATTATESRSSSETARAGSRSRPTPPSS